MKNHIFVHLLVQQLIASSAIFSSNGAVLTRTYSDKGHMHTNFLI